MIWNPVLETELISQVLGDLHIYLIIMRAKKFWIYYKLLLKENLFLQLASQLPAGCLEQFGMEFIIKVALQGVHQTLDIPIPLISRGYNRNWRQKEFFDVIFKILELKQTFYFIFEVLISRICRINNLKQRDKEFLLMIK